MFLVLEHKDVGRVARTNFFQVMCRARYSAQKFLLHPNRGMTRNRKRHNPVVQYVSSASVPISKDEFGCRHCSCATRDGTVCLKEWTPFQPQSKNQLHFCPAKIRGSIRKKKVEHRNSSLSLDSFLISTWPVLYYSSNSFLLFIHWSTL